MYRTSNGSEKRGNRRRQNRIVFRLPYIGQKSSEFGHGIKKQVAAAYPTVKTTLSFSTTYAYRKIARESLPTTTISSVIYFYTCAGEATYVGKTTQRLTEQIKQHIPDKISNNGVKRTDSAILAHLKSNHSCIPGDKEHAIDRFRILAGRSQCHLNVLEAVFIKSLSPSMCLQNEHMKKRMLFR